MQINIIVVRSLYDMIHQLIFFLIMFCSGRRKEVFDCLYLFCFIEKKAIIYFFFSLSFQDIWYQYSFNLIKENESINGTAGIWCRKSWICI
jgi:hypothetical protein